MFETGLADLKRVVEAPASARWRLLAPHAEADSR
jgi:hypothetical protein